MGYIRGKWDILVGKRNLGRGGPASRGWLGWKVGTTTISSHLYLWFILIIQTYLSFFWATSRVNVWSVKPMIANTVWAVHQRPKGCTRGDILQAWNCQLYFLLAFIHLSNFLAAGMFQILQEKRLNMIFYSFIVPHVALIGKGLYTRENIRENIWEMEEKTV